MILASAIILLTYVAYICRMGFPNSISESYYSLKNKWLFTAVLCSSSLLIYFGLMDVTKPGFEILTLAVCFGLITVGFSPNFMQKGFDRRIHITGAAMSGIASQIWVAVHYPFSLLWWIPFIAMAVIFPSKRLFFCEVTAVITIFYSVLTLS